jgi:hypothetical protein
MVSIRLKIRIAAGVTRTYPQSRWGTRRGGSFPFYGISSMTFAVAGMGLFMSGRSMVNQ